MSTAASAGGVSGQLDSAATAHNSTSTPRRRQHAPAVPLAGLHCSSHAGGGTIPPGPAGALLRGDGVGVHAQLTSSHSSIWRPALSTAPPTIHGEKARLTASAHNVEAV